MLIAFAGTDGSGKSTQVKEVKNRLLKEGYKVQILDKWDILKSEKFPECKFIDTSLNDLRVNIAEMQGISRALFLFWSITITLTKDQLENEDTIYLLDGYWMKHAASEIEYGCDERWIELTCKQFPKADLTFYFDVPPEIALKRKPELTPYECGLAMDLNKTKFINHQTNLRNRLLNWADTYQWLKISSLEPKEKITNFVVEKISQVTREKNLI
jgi:thymidylate kinase